MQKFIILTSLFSLCLLSIEVEAQNIIKAEYFFDVDNGFGANNTIPITNASSDLTLSFTADLSGLSNGVHTLYIRAQNSNGTWGLVSKRLILVSGSVNENIVAIEYYYILDGNLVSEHRYEFSNPAPVIETDFPADASNLVNGNIYIMYIAAISESGVPSIVNAISLNYSEPQPISINIETNNVNCNGESNGSIQASATGGLGSFQYSLDNISFSNEGNFSELTAGEYNLYVKDTGLDSVIVRQVTIEEPDPLVLTIEETQLPTCPNDATGILTLVVTGGNGEYTFQLDGGETTTNAAFENLTAGSYTFSVTDAIGCTTIQEINLTNSGTVLGKPNIVLKEGIIGTSDVITLSTDSIANAYQWFVDGLAIDEGTTRDITLTKEVYGDSNLEVQIEITNNGTCKAISDVFNVAFSSTSNRPPVISGTPATSVVVNQIYSFIPTATDVDNDDLTFSITNKPTWADFNTITGELSGTSINIGTFENIEICVSDGNATVCLPIFSITIGETPNSSPIISGSPSISVIVNQTYSFTPTVSDSENDDLTFSITNQPSWATFDNNTGELSGIPTTTGTYNNIEICVTDGKSSPVCLPIFDISVVDASIVDIQITSNNFTQTVARQVSDNIPASPLITLSSTEGVGKVEMNYGDFREDILNNTQTQTSFNSDTVSFELPISATDELGVSYQFQVYDQSDNLLVSSDTGYAYLSYENNAQSPFIQGLRTGATQSAYRLISIPYALDDANVLSVFDELVPYDDTQWRLFEYANGNREKESGSLQRGKGYWFITRNNANIKVGTGSTTLPNDEPLTINLNTDWNLIGNPYPFSINWQDVLYYNGFCNNDFQVIGYNNGTFTNLNSISAYGGFFVNSSNPQTLRIPFTPNVTIPASCRISEPLLANAPLDAVSWQLPISLSVGELGNQLGGIGMHPLANEGFDNFDALQIPRFLDYVDMHFINKEKNIAKDITTTTSEYIWEFEIETSLIGNEVTIDWENTHFGNNTRNLWLLDVHAQLLTDMRKQNTYSFTGEKSRPFKIFYGEIEQLQTSVLPKQASLGNPYPNPSNGSFKVPFTLPKAKDSYQIQLTLHDITGKEIASLIYEQRLAGFYEENISMRLKTGIYIIRLTIDDTLISGSRLLVE